MPAYNDFKYEILSDNSINITDYLGNDEHVYIPLKIKNHPVTSIGCFAFDKCHLHTIKIPNNITYIGTYAFANCTSLESITIPSSVVEMGNYVFNGCTSLKHITIKSKTIDIGRNTFFGCGPLTISCLPNSNIEKWAKINGYNVVSMGSKLSNFLSCDDNLNGGIYHAEI